MKKCYKCQKPYVEPSGPGFQEVCEGCSSYLHCCQNCDFYDSYQPNSCTEPMAEYVSDLNGMTHCEYFRFKVTGGRKLSDDDEGRRFKKADWRNLNKDDKTARSPGRRRVARNPFAPRGGDGRNSRASSSGGLFGGREDRDRSVDRAQKAREALDNLFKKE